MILKEKLILLEDYQHREGEWEDAEQLKSECYTLRTLLEENRRTIDNLVL